MKLIEILNLNRELLINFQKAGIRLDDVQYIDLFNEYRTLATQGEKVSYIVAHLASEYNVSERKVYSLIKRYKTECNSLIFGGVICSLGNALHWMCSAMGRRASWRRDWPHYLCTVFKIQNGHEQISPNLTQGAY